MTRRPPIRTRLAVGLAMLLSAGVVASPPGARPAPGAGPGGAAGAGRAIATIRPTVRLYLPARPGQPAGRAVWEAPGPTTPARLALLVHGLDEPGSVWDDLAPALHGAGHAVARFDYPNDQPIADSAGALGEALRDLRRAGTTEVDLICHSMGGLMARDVLTRPALYAGRCAGGDALPAVGRLIMLGTPQAGSAWAQARVIAEMRDQVERWWRSPDWDPRPLLNGFEADGAGEAGRDLMPGSAYLTDLNARPLPEGAPITLVIGRLAPIADEDLAWVARSPLVRELLGEAEARRLVAWVRSVSTELGDGVVPAPSAELPGVTDIVYVEANHRGMVTTIPIEQQVRGLVGAPVQATPPAIPIILDRLARRPAEPR